MIAMHRKCPSCQRYAQWEDNPWRPFCSERCKLADLGAWSAESYRIPEEPGEGSGEEWSEVGELL